ncbi:epoxide hydrolase [Bradyrhizobium manausense]|uniref:epoxide hydrolase family protein n=1 Tax=Bradyrhizobium manausense TaxID=989370 RepID=UPI001BA84607|nr:epoxide hydrolase family protein [Bradyrhizobium manausense]MBR0684386.1 epoxide hydrolase [Bradyrhizobium manausense]
MTVSSFKLDITDSAIEDLRRRLASTRLPAPIPGDPWQHGTSVPYLAELIRYWREKFDWRAEEDRLNVFPQSIVKLADVDLHCLHVPGKGPSPRPLLLCHGWPGSVFEFLEIIPRLTDPARFGGDPSRSFTVVAPSMPGYGLSFQAGQRGFGVEEIAECYVQLMEVLGYDRFVVQGGDWGAFVGTRMALQFPQNVMGLHLNLMPLRREKRAAEDSFEEKAYDDELAAWLKEEMGYYWIQGTRPQTLSFGLNDSPAGLAAWIAEKFRTWSDCDGEIENAISRDRLLANISFYWFTGTIGSSCYPYYARMHRPWPTPTGQTIQVPMAYTEFPKEMVRPPRSLAEKTFTNIRRWTVMPKGGHFAALEQPALLAQDIVEFDRQIGSRP